MTMGENVGRRVHDSAEMFGDGTVLEHDAVEVLVDWDRLAGGPIRMRWNDGVELIDELP